MSTPSQASISRLTLRHWTTDSRFVGGAERPARALPFSEQIQGGRFHRLASKLAQVRSKLASERTTTEG